MAEREHDGSEWGPANPPPATPKAEGLTEAEFKTLSPGSWSFQLQMKILATIDQLRAERDLLLREVHRWRFSFDKRDIRLNTDSRGLLSDPWQIERMRLLEAARTAVEAAGIKIGGGK